ncbi:MAG: bifunctional methylenetetrahydrofolate dehydrogenase/methenyltetrahydrofolate cyclohydrolase FolD [Alphaproteobacteria bacterium]
MSLAVKIDGKKIAETIRQDIAEQTKNIKQQNQKAPSLAVIQVGLDAASSVYVANKKKFAKEVGFDSLIYNLEEQVSEKELLTLIAKLNQDDNVNGILVQLPLPKHIDEENVINNVSPEKDVDCFHPYNVGKLFTGKCLMPPCTPNGCLHLIKTVMPDLKGKKALVIGRSNIVGKPVAKLLLDADATVTMAHSKTANLKEECLEADIVVAAIGKPAFVKGDWIKVGAVVIDVGINRIEDSSKPSGYRLCGDVDFDEAATRASAITPVPGGVGPMTIAMLLQNTLTAFKIQKLDIRGI